MGRRWWWLLAGLATMLVIGTPACRPKEEAQRPNPTPRAHFTAAQVSTIHIDSIRAYVETLHFSSKPGWADVQLVTFSPWRIGVGDSAWIEPEEGSNLVDTTSLAQGRIVARIRSKAVYGAVNFGPWWTYWWVDKNGVDKAGNRTWRSLFIPDSASLSRTFRDLVFKGRIHPDDYYLHAKALFFPNEDGTWFNCGGCCRTTT